MYSNVLLNEEEYKELKKEIPNIDEVINKLSIYIKHNGDKYKNHKTTPKTWYQNENK